MSGDWNRIKEGKIDAIAFFHKHHINLFMYIKGEKVQLVIDRDIFDEILTELNLAKVERVMMDETSKFI